MILPTVSTFVVANVATLFTNQANLYAFFGESVSYKNYTIGYYLFVLVNKVENGKTMYTYASALGIVCTLIAFPLTMLVRKLLNAVGGDE
jgi:ABC-type sugar transport system permease subunit